jgi:phosphatidylserine decarboxylase
MGKVARSPASRWLCRAFVAAYRVDLSEAEPSGGYPTLEALFTRRLREGARPVSADPDAIVSPIDGTCAWAGPSRGGSIEVAPGRWVSLAAILGEPVVGERDVIVGYLSPRDYHRVHVPREGLARAWRYVPGTLWPVFPGAVRRVRDLFARNERVVVAIETDRGLVQVVLIGAFGVGRISLTLCDLLTNTGGRAAHAILEPPRALRRGEELGTFHLGSTVVLVAPPGQWRLTVAAGDRMRVGERIAAGVPRLGLVDGTG